MKTAAALLSLLPPFIALVAFDRAYALIFCVCVLIHEAAHICAAAVCGVKLLGISPSPLGVVINLDLAKASYGKEFFIASAGCAANMICALAAAVAMKFHSLVYFDFLAVNIFLFCVNILPVRNFDGGRMLFCLLSRFAGLRVRDIVCECASCLVSVCVWLIFSYFMLCFGTGIYAVIFFALAFAKTLHESPAFER